MSKAQCLSENKENNFIVTLGHIHQGNLKD